MEALGTLAAGVAHDFNNVLQGILGCLLMANRPGTPRDRVNLYLSSAAEGARRGGELAASLVGFARERGPGPGRTEVDLEIEHHASLLRSLVGVPVEVELELDAPGAVLEADPVELEQILLNLAANARDAMPGGGGLRIRTAILDRDEVVAGASRLPDGPVLRLEVEDEGSGMDEATRSRIFDPFFTTKGPDRGTGLGLATVGAICERLRGTVDVESAPGRGTRFVFHLPCRRASGATLPPPPPAMATLRGVILVVDDEPLIRLTVRHYLEKRGLTVVEAEDACGARALFDLHAEDIDVLVTDVQLRDDRGPSLAAELEARSAEGLGVVFMTANPYLLDRAETQGARVLQKPFDDNALVSEIAALLGVAPPG